MLLKMVHSVNSLTNVTNHIIRGVLYMKNKKQLDLIRSGTVWRDTDGEIIQAHGGGVLYHDGIYYWFGENKGADNNRLITVNIKCWFYQMRFI